MPRKPLPRGLKTLPGGTLSPFEVPTTPFGLTQRSKDQWVAIWSAPIARVLNPDLDGDTIEALLKLRDERDRNNRIGQKQRIVIGSQGQPVINPALGHAMAIQKEIRALEDRLGLNPKARLTLGILLGDATRSIEDVNAEFARDEFSDLVEDDERVVRRTG